MFKSFLLFLYFFLLSFTNSENKELNPQIYWGTYKPHLIFAMTERTLSPLTVGFFYYNRVYDIEDHEVFLANVRYRYRSDIHIRFLEHNSIDYALEHIEDSLNRLFCEVKLLKEKFSNLSSQSWIATVKNEFRYSEDLDEAGYQSNSNKISFVFYLNIRNLVGSEKFTAIRLKKYEKDQYVVLEIFERNSSNFEGKIKGFLRIEAFEEKCFQTQSFIDFLRIDEQKIWDIDNIYYKNTMQSEDYRAFEKNPEFKKEFSEIPNDSNVFFMNFFLQNNCKYVISYDSSQIPTSFDEKKFEELLKEKRNSFYDQFFLKFADETVGFATENSLKKLKLSMYSFSNLIGGISHYYGKFKEINNIYEHSFKEVFTMTPSRTKFPRGFLWDEGFHLLILCRFHEDLCKKIIENWLGLMDINGWIAREQIRNEETAFGLEERFIGQDNYEGNPPTLIFPILYLMKNLEKSKNLENSKNFLHNCFNKLKLWFFWFLEQQNDREKTDFFDESELFSEKLSFRWHCKGNCHNGNFLGSGLDDFPRQTAGTWSKSHLDMHTWLLFFAESLMKISKFLNYSDEETLEYQSIFHSLSAKLQEEFFDTSDKIFKDVVSEAYNPRNKAFNNNIGYINLFPLLFGYVEKNSQILQEYLRILTDPNQLWSDFGIRSLSISSRFFGTGDNYWRGPIWIPLNYLILRALKNFYYDNEEVKRIYGRLRENIVNNMVKNFEYSGHVWENYNAIDGAGQREIGFCGWSALITLIIKEEYF